METVIQLLYNYYKTVKPENVYRLTFQSEMDTSDVLVESSSSEMKVDFRLIKKEIIMKNRTSSIKKLTKKEKVFKD